MEFIHNGKLLNINKEHYDPSFIARDVDELGENKDARLALRKLNLMAADEEKKEEENKSDNKSEKLDKEIKK